MNILNILKMFLPYPVIRSSGHLVILLGCLAACSPKVDMGGYMRELEFKDQIVAGKTTKDEVLGLFGSPSSQSTFGQETWYYISSRKEAVAFMKPEAVEQQVVKIEFDAAGIVSNVHTFSEKDSKEFSLVKRTTPTEGHELGFFEQILGNIGRFNKPPADSGIAPGRRPSGRY